MKISKKIVAALNSQINKEFSSGYLYLSMSAYLEANNLLGFANWMKLQAKEEESHGFKIYNFILERGGEIDLLGIEKPKSDWKSPLEIFKATYEHELKITEAIYNLVEIAKEEKDYATLEFLNWFVKEQVEEEANTSFILEKLELVKDNIGGLFIIDKELGMRKEG